MTHEENKSLYYSAVRNVTEHISDYAVSPEKDFTREKNSPQTSSFTSWLRRARQAPKTNCSISLTWTRTPRRPPPSTSNVPSSARKPLRPFSVVSTHRSSLKPTPRNMNSSPSTVLALPFSAIRVFHPRNTTSPRDIRPGDFTASMYMPFTT